LRGKKSPRTWDTEPTWEFDAWFDSLEGDDQEQVIAAQMYLEQTGPMARMPLSYPIAQDNSCGMKELRPGSSGRSEIRILYAFDYRRRGILLLGGDKAGDWNAWYDRNVPVADERFKRHEQESRSKDPEAAAGSGKQVKPKKKSRGRKNR
jgi:hypothetical protein